MAMEREREADLEGGAGSPALEEVRRRRRSLESRRAEFKAHLEKSRNQSWLGFVIDRLKILVPIAVTVVLASLAVTTFLWDEVQVAFAWAEDNKPVSVVYYALLFSVWVLVFLPKTILSLAGGFVFGFWYGLLGGTLGMFLGLIFTITLVRTVLTWCGCRQKMRDWLLRTYIEVRVLNDLMQTEPMRAIFLVKMSLIPTWVKSYALAILDAPSHLHLFVGFWSGLIYSAMMVFLGAAAKTIIEAIEASKPVTPEAIAVQVVGILMTLAVLVYLRFKIKAAIRRAEQEMDAREEEELRKLESKLAGADAGQL